MFAIPNGTAHTGGTYWSCQLIDTRTACYRAISAQLQRGEEEEAFEEEGEASRNSTRHSLLLLLLHRLLLQYDTRCHRSLDDAALRRPLPSFPRHRRRFFFFRSFAVAPVAIPRRRSSSTSATIVPSTPKKILLLLLLCGARCHPSTPQLFA